MQFTFLSLAITVGICCLLAVVFKSLGDTSAGIMSRIFPLLILAPTIGFFVLLYLSSIF